MTFAGFPRELKYIELVLKIGFKNWFPGFLSSWRIRKYFTFSEFIKKIVIKKPRV
jgi:hypothetical protein